MNEELNFEAAPFEGFRELAAEQGGFEWEEEFGRAPRSRSRAQSFSPRPSRTVAQRPAAVALAKAKTPRFPSPGRWPWGALGAYGVPLEPYPVESQPYPVEPPSTRSEYMRWVQSALNDVLGLQLPVHGIGDSATRSAIRSFQQQQGLPADGVVGPDTERALLAARQPTAPQSPGGQR